MKSVRESERSPGLRWYYRNREQVLDRQRRDVGRSARRRKNYAANHDRHVTAQKRFTSLRRAFIDAAMAGGCVDCGEKNLNLLDLDHVRGEKVASVSRMINAQLPILFAEIDKCETRCANCHRYVTAQRRKQRGLAVI